MTISKSDYMLFLKHPAWLWLKKRDKVKLPPIDASTQAMFDTGFLFETYAEQLFPTGAKIGFNDYQEYLSLPQRTQAALDEGIGTIFQGRYVHGNFTFICDIVQVVADKTVDLYEIKSSTQAKPEHEFDLAFQMVVLENCGYTVRNISVIHVNNQFVKDGFIKPEDICLTTDITDRVKAKRDETVLQMADAYAVADDITMPDPSPRHAKLKSLSEWLKIYRGFNEVGEDSIYDLCSPTAKQLGQLEDLGIKELVDIPSDFKLGTKQQRQVETAKAGEPVIQPDEIKSFVGRLEYPLYFLDYETMSSLVPYFDGMKPYQQVPFQYSLHILDAPGAELRHEEYLHSDNTHPGLPLSTALQSHIGESGSVITWNKSFEMNCNERLGKMFPEFEDFFAKVNSRVVDLMEPFSNGWYVDAAFGGSSSIKYVLPIIAPDLSYKALDIQEGASAQRLWMEAVLDGKHGAGKQKILDDLIEYCGLDTLAMVKIFEFLNDL